MAESDSGWWSSQMSGIVNTIKQQSEQAFRATQRDLAELVITVQADTSNFVTGATSQLGTYLWSRGDDDGIEVDRGDDIDDKEEEIEPYKPESDYELCKEPNGPEYEQWKENFTLEKYNDQISELLAESSEVRGQHSTLVPSELSNLVFWQRYFFHQHMTEQGQLQKQKLINRADASSDDDLDSWEEIDGNCFKDSEKEGESKPKAKESELDEEWISWDD